MTRSGSGNPRSTPASTEMGSGSGGVLMLNLAAVKAVPENAYRSHTIIAPEFKVLWMAALFSQRLAENKRWIAWSSRSEVLERYELIIWPIGVVRSGNLIDSTARPASLSFSSNRRHCVDFPDLSSPSKTMKLPR